MLIKDVASQFGDKVKVVTEEYGNSPMAEKWGVRRYPVVFVDDVLVARPKDFGFAGEDDKSKGLYVPWRDTANQQRFKADVRRMVERRLHGERVSGLDVDDVRTAAVPADGPETLPALTAAAVTGGALDAKTFAGRVVVVEMWATWCPPCRSTVSWLKTLQARYGDRLVVVAIAVDSPAAEVQKTADEIKPNYHIVQGSPALVGLFGDVAAVPKLFVFDPAGKRVETFYGAPPDLHDRIAATVARHAK